MLVLNENQILEIKIMFCKQCGSELKDGAVLCTNCGAKQTVEVPAAAPVQ